MLWNILFIDYYIIYIILILLSNISFVNITVITNTGILPLYTHTHSNNKVKKILSITKLKQSLITSISHIE